MDLRRPIDLPASFLILRHVLVFLVRGVAGCAEKLFVDVHFGLCIGN